ncbi:flagellar hook-basal body complex protein FliE [Rhodohalobacter mucosus]|uniref:Flagellar hook-basal body complex protein FliE n=1 Tax=Rhodohalobacter mucosus TaxID=2079485 RepID=A0A316TNF3_9BACT|nr:flagellar hook-basal body complex protein FliE [Rhodohalobacter mucosus]PWN05171.1 flagellar hook-basal body complex protein FliE [Rhodohalobacter mucosus]
MAIDPITIQALRQNPAMEGRDRIQEVGFNDSSNPEGSFADMIRDAVQSVDAMQKESETGVENILAGKAENIHEVMISMQKAQLSFQLMVEMRNKAVETYQELSRMQI